MVYNQKPSPLGVPTMYHDDDPRPFSRRYPSYTAPVDTRSGVTTADEAGRGEDLRRSLRVASDRLDEIRLRRITLTRALYTSGILTPEEYASALCDETERRRQEDLGGFC